jgi:hypothetical protein
MGFAMRQHVLVFLCLSATALGGCSRSGGHSRADIQAEIDALALEAEIRARETTWNLLCSQLGHALDESHGGVPRPFVPLTYFLLESCVLHEDLPMGASAPEDFVPVRDHYLEWRDRWYASGFTLPQGTGSHEEPLRARLPATSFGVHARCESAIGYLSGASRVYEAPGTLLTKDATFDKCAEEGLSHEQLRCILDVDSGDAVARLRSCPAIAENPPSWLNLPPP